MFRVINVFPFRRSSKCAIILLLTSRQKALLEQYWEKAQRSFRVANVFVSCSKSHWRTSKHQKMFFWQKKSQSNFPLTHWTTTSNAWNAYPVNSGSWFCLAFDRCSFNPQTNFYHNLTNLTKSLCFMLHALDLLCIKDIAMLRTIWKVKKPDEIVTNKNFSFLYFFFFISYHFSTFIWTDKNEYFLLDNSSGVRRNFFQIKLLVGYTLTNPQKKMCKPIHNPSTNTQNIHLIYD